MLKFKLKNILYIQIISFLLILSLNKSFPTDNFSKYKKWDDKTLFQYIKDNHISKIDSTEIKHLQFMIIDPNEYLKINDLNESILNIQSLFTEFKITFFIFIINSIKENNILSYQLKDFLYKINNEIYKYNKKYDEKKTISTLFAVEDNKMLIRVGSTCRQIISDSEAMKILKKRKKDLDEKNMKKLIYDLSEDILLTYRKNYEKAQNKIIPTYIKIIFYIIIIILFGYIYYHFIKNNFSPKSSEKFLKIEMSSQIGKKIQEFIKNNNNKSLKNVMEQYCLICVENYDGINNNVLLEDEVTSNEKIILPCEHVFHLKCISQYFLKETNCPLCKSKFEYDNKDGKIIINNYFLNHNWKYNKSINFKNIIKDFLKMQKIINPDEITDNYCNQIINEYSNKQEYHFFKNVKIFNINKNLFQD